LTISATRLIEYRYWIYRRTMMTSTKTTPKQATGAVLLALALMASLWIPTLTVPAQAETATVTLPALA
jgi:hypothetical protein